MDIALYARVSTDEQTPEVQLRELREYSKARGMRVVAEIADVISGAKSDRPGLDQLLALVRDRKVEAVLCVKLDRMARSLVHFGRLADLFVQSGVALICTTQGIDTSNSNPCGKFQQNILAAVAEFERDLIRERTRAGLAAARARGMTIGRVSPKMPNREGRAEIVQAWRESGGRDYRKLGEMLGGVSGATAWRVAKQVRAVASPAAA
jgi:putative DNA-invertase from lambdoid prophage Rac